MKEYHSAMNLHLSGGNIRIIPLLLVSCDIPLFTYETHYIDFRDKDRYDSSFKELLETLTVRPSDKQGPVLQYQHHAQRVITLSRKRSLFIGRSALVHQIVETLQKSDHPISLVGEGGVGKTSVAYIVLEESISSFDLLVQLYFDIPISYRIFLTTIAEQMEIPRDVVISKDDLTLEHIIKERLRKKGHLLIYVDGYDNILYRISSKRKPEDALIIHNFLETLPNNVSVLLTSRLRNNLVGEELIDIEGLSDMEGEKLFHSVARRHFKNITNEMKQKLRGLSATLYGHPLAIKLLAGAYRGGGTGEIDNMSDNILMKLKNEKEVVRRQKSIDACFDYSFKRLTMKPKRLVLNLIIFKSPFPGDVVAIFGSNYSLLFDLYNLSWLRRIDFDEFGELEETYRLYFFHPVVRKYLEKEAQAAQMNLYREYGKEVVAFLFQLLGQIKSAIINGNNPSLVKAFNIMINGSENDFEMAISMLRSLPNKYQFSDFLNMFGLCLSEQGIYATALSYHKDCLAVDVGLKDRTRIATDCLNLSICYDGMHDYHRASFCAEKLLSERQKLSQNESELARGYTQVGYVLRHLGDYENSENNATEAARIYGKLGDKEMLGMLYSLLADLALAKGDIQGAFERHQEALSITESVDNELNLANVYSAIGLTFRNIGQDSIALFWWMKALEINKKCHDIYGIARESTFISNVLVGKQELNRALEYRKDALKMHSILGDNMAMQEDNDAIESINSELQRRND